MKIKPFKAFRFNPDVVGDIGKCTAPPYDVINPKQQQELYAKSEHNIVRIIKGKILPSDDGQQNTYTRAADYLNQWIAEGALKQDSQECIYGYVQDFDINGTSYQRLSFIALGKIEDFGATVKPHEQIFQKPMTDRLMLKRATNARFGLVFMLYDDPEQIAENIIEKISSRPVLVDTTDEQNVRHRLFCISDTEDIEKIIAMMSDKSCIIADGHHRYTTGLTYWKQTGNPEARYQMFAFTNTIQKGLLVLATHRIVSNLENFKPEEFLKNIQEDFEVTTFAFNDQTKESAKQQMLDKMKAEHDNDKTTYGICIGDNNFYTATLKDKTVMDLAAPNTSSAYRALDVAVLQKIMFEKVLGIDDSKTATEQYISYVKDTRNAIDESIAAIEAKENQIAFFTNPVKMEQLKAITDAGERMPQKSTYFYPKMHTGFTIQKL
jgi:uncharacterized protein (DUF1015 family)